ncbi:MAG: coenzyme F420-0:L-glutamate ligase [Archaeoglobus sp.]|nr:MAG: coenzyme F420-0:L-glutamate ligase [Archaeoglobus sp.]
MHIQKIELIPIRYKVEPNVGLSSLANVIAKYAKAGDIAVVSSKVVSYCEGGLVKLADIKPSNRALRLSKQYKIPPELAELIVREADDILGGIERFILTLKFGMLCPNAGIDTSNVPEGYAILYPENPQKSADTLRNLVERRIDGRVGVVISDSRILPLRRGVCGIAIATSGFEAIKDERGKPDLFGKPLRNTMRNLADMLASASQLLMGEANEMIPIVIVRGLNVRFTEEKFRLTVDPKKCLYWGSLNGKVCWSDKSKP